MNILADTIAHDLCCGCGACVNVCPTNHLGIQFTSKGFFEAIETKNTTCIKCSLCMSVCPFSQNSKNTDFYANKTFSGLNYIDDCGYFDGAFVGYASDDIRANSASGGLLSALLITLLESKKIDYALCVTQVSTVQPFFDYTVCRTKQDILECSSSKYYPVSAEHAIELINQEEGLCAITALPCLAKSLSALKYKKKNISAKLKYIVGLVCGQMKSSLFTDYLCEKAGGDSARISSVLYRDKQEAYNLGKFISFSHSPYSYLYKFSDSQSPLKIGFHGDISMTWKQKEFTMNSCLHCDDVFAECSDVAFMDAWAKPYSDSPKGHNFIISRSERITEILLAMDKKEGFLIKEHPISEVVKSQSNVLFNKRQLTSKNIDKIKKEYGPLGFARERLMRNPGFVGSILSSLTYKISEKSIKNWLYAKGDVKSYELSMNKLYFVYKYTSLFYRVLCQIKKRLQLL